MPRELILILKIPVLDLPDEERAQLADDMGHFDGPEGDDLPTVDDVQAAELANVIANALETDEAQARIFEGSEIYAKLGEITVIQALFENPRFDWRPEGDPVIDERRYEAQLEDGRVVTVQAVVHGADEVDFITPNPKNPDGEWVVLEEEPVRLREWRDRRCFA